MSLDIDPNDISLFGNKNMKWGAVPPMPKKVIPLYRALDVRPGKKQKVVASIDNPDHYGWLRSLEAVGAKIQKQEVDGSWVDVEAPNDETN
ncbi:hypothetical protein SEA_UZUMAKI_85 [Arthrobacter phage Uzumaki]|nr:hypothetical protein SEA_UZUMAKI_85 [Arthrobacter phage Uzumaki]